MMPPLVFALVIGNAQLVGTDLPGDALAVSGTKIVSVGTTAELKARCAAPCVYVDARRAFLLPGLHDAHAHPYKGGQLFYDLRVSGSSVSSIQSAVREFARSHPEREWIVGRGWDAEGFGGRFPNRTDLDAAEAKRPVVITDSDGHQVWTNTAAIRAAGVTAATPDPEGGRIVREADGSPSGIFLEGATSLIGAKVPVPAPDVRRGYVLKGQEPGLSAGITAFSGGPISPIMADTYRELSKSGEFVQRAWLWADLEADDAEFARWLEWDRQGKAQGSKVRLGAFKGFVDGVISANTAAMLAPYSDTPGEKGEPLIQQARLNQLVARANRAGYPVALHAIGDRAVRMSLDAFEASPVKGLPNRIEHIESLDPADAPRFGALGVLASMQPSHMYFSSEGSSYYPRKLGPERLKHAFAWNELAQGGAKLVFGTDYPVVAEDPMESFFCAIRRVYRNGSPFEPTQRVSPQLALAAWTSNPAEAVGEGKRLGRLAPGYEADLALFPRDPRSGEVRSSYENRPQRVWISGIDVLRQR